MGICADVIADLSTGYPVCFFRADIPSMADRGSAESWACPGISDPWYLVFSIVDVASGLYAFWGRCPTLSWLHLIDRPAFLPDYIWMRAYDGFSIRAVEAEVAGTSAASVSAASSYSDETQLMPSDHYALVAYGSCLHSIPWCDWLCLPSLANLFSCF